MNCAKVSNHIIDWLKEKVEGANLNGFVVGVSGGVDSALVSTLCALTGKKTVCMNLPIHQAQDQLSRADKHIEWLKKTNANVEGITVNLSRANDTFIESCGEIGLSDLAKANIRSRLRMVTLYAMANSRKLLVVGTGNAIEDGSISRRGCGFYTKFGDGGVDISPISDLLKSEVRELSRFLGILPELAEAVPTDGLWPDNFHTDENQLGASYDELEWGLKWYSIESTMEKIKKERELLTERQKEVLKILLDRYETNKHKMRMPPVCEISDELKQGEES